MAIRDYVEWRVAASEAGVDVGYVPDPEDPGEVSNNVVTSLRSWVDSTGLVIEFNRFRW